ncbi:MAG: CDP-glycerol glycerophosphotransferase family protein [Lachnospiraceae bacterium]
MKLKDDLSKLADTILQEQKRKSLLRDYKKGNLKNRIAKYNINSYQSLKKTNPDCYDAVKEYIYEQVLSTLKQKEKIKVGFVAYSASMWSCDELFQLFAEDERFEPSIILGRFYTDSDLKTFPLFEKAKTYFAEKGYHVTTVDLDTPGNRAWEKMGSPDILFYLTPYDILMPKEINLKYMPANVLCAYIPYCFILCDEGNLAETAGIGYSWKYFCESALYRDILIAKNEKLKNHIEYIGYPRMDKFYEKEAETCSKWKYATEKRDVKKIVYALHHSFDSESDQFSTFVRNGKQILEYATSHTDTTSWIVKLHPNFRRNAVDAGVFASKEACDEYFTAWNELPNACVVEESTYADIFMTSDAMLCDCVSFLAEYQFTGKPLLLLENENHKPFNAFGRKIYEIIYKVKGEDIAAIYDFLNATVLEGQDSMCAKRQEFFEQYMDYRKNSGSASEQIYRYVKKVVE